MKKRRGISLVALIITIIVLIILTATVILVFKNDGIIDKAKEATFRNDITVFKEELLQYVLNKQVETLNAFDKTTLTKTTYNDIKEIIKSFIQKYENKVIIYKGEIAVDFTNLDEKEIEWAEDLNLSILSSSISNGIVPNEAKVIKNYRIYGNSVQNGTPTPTNHIEVVSLGENSKNLFDTNKMITERTTLDGYPNISTYKISGLKPNTNYTFSSNTPGDDSTGAGYFIGINRVADSLTGADNGVCLNRPRTVSSNVNGELWIYTFNLGYEIDDRYLDNDIIKDNNYCFQLEEGSTATEYRPYNCVDVVSSGKNLFPNFNSFNKFVNLPILKNARGGGLVAYSGAAEFSNSQIYIPSNFEALKITEQFANLNPDTTYTFSFSMTEFGGRLYAFLGKDYNYNGSNVRGEYTFTTTNDGSATLNMDKGIIYITSQYLTIPSEGIYLSDFQLEEGNTATQYEPYQEPITTTIALTGHDPLRKIGDVADYIDYENGKIVRNIGKIDLGSLNYIRAKYGALYLFYAVVQDFDWRYVSDNSSVPVLCSNYSSWTGVYGETPNNYMFIGNENFKRNCIALRNDDYLNTAEFKNSLSNIYVYYPLATPIEESITLPRLPDNTKEVQVISNGNILPSNVEIEYYTEN